MGKKRNLKTSLLIAVLLVGIGYTIAAADVIYVNANAPGPTHDGTSWPSAYLSLQDALDRPPTSGDQIWVAAGTYKPGSSRTDSFEMVNGVTIYGGFPDSGEPNLADRDWQSNETILSGDIGAVGNNTDNCYHVVYNPEGANLGSTAVLDGFTLTGGNANGGTYWWGGGLFNISCSPTVTNCTFYGNAAATMGGGMANHDHSSPTVTNCTFYDNSVTSPGGGLSNSVYSSPAVTNCTFYGNTAGMSGGGIWNEVYSSPIVTNCILWANSPDSIDNTFSSPLVTYCDVQAGTGQIWFGEGCIDEDPCLFDATGGDFHLLGDSPCIDAGTNSAPNLPATDFGGYTRIINGIVDMGADEYSIFYELTTSTEPEEGGTITLTPPGGYYPEGRQVTVTANPAAGYVFDHWSGDLVGSTNPNSVVMDANKTVTAHFLPEYTLTVSTAPSGAGMVILNPPGGTYAEATVVTLTAQAVAGYALDYWSGDLTGSTNPTAIIMDSNKAVTAHFTFTGIVYVNDDAIGANNGGSWANAFTDLQDALQLATTGFEIWVAEGTYKPRVEHGGSGSRFKSFQMKNYVTIYGGFADSGDPNLADRDPWVYETILSGDIGSQGDQSDNCYHVFYHPYGMNLDSNAVLDGFTVTAGYGSPYENGGGMCNLVSSPAVINCVFRQNEASYSAGGMYNYVSSPTVINCVFVDNKAGTGGGGMSNDRSSPTLVNCIFMYNQAVYGGGGMRNYNRSSPTLVNCTFYRNSSPDWPGGGMSNTDVSSPTLSNCTFYGNTCTWHGGGIYNEGWSLPTVTNSILWADIPDEIWDDTFDVNSTVTYCNVQGGTGQKWFGTGCIDQKPKFTSPPVGDLHLLADSPCIDSGDNVAVPAGVTDDLDGEARIVDGDNNGTATVDMGAYEFIVEIPGDVNGDGRVDFLDVAIIGNNWLKGTVPE